MLDKDEDNNLEGGVIYSNNISEVDSNYYSNFKEQKHDNTNNYDINKTGQDKKLELELTSITNSSTSTNSLEYNDIVQEEKLDEDENIKTPIIENEKEIKEDNEDKEPLLLYGNNINNMYPKYLGNMLSFFYVKNQPLISIGPDCKFLFI